MRSFQRGQPAVPSCGNVFQRCLLSRKGGGGVSSAIISLGKKANYKFKTEITVCTLAGGNSKRICCCCCCSFERVQMGWEDGIGMERISWPLGKQLSSEVKHNINLCGLQFSRKTYFFFSLLIAMFSIFSSRYHNSRNLSFSKLSTKLRKKIIMQTRDYDKKSPKLPSDDFNCLQFKIHSKLPPQPCCPI